MIFPDFIFSYWIFAWFLIYYAVPYDIPSPKLSILFALIENIAELFFLLTVEPTMWKIVLFILMIVVMKGIPLYLLRNVPIVFSKDILSLIVVFLLYNAYLFARNTNVVAVYNTINTSLKKGDDQTPLYWMANKLYSFLSRKFAK